MTYLPWALAFAVSLIGVVAILWLGSRIGLLDEPNHRSLHRTPTVRSGGAGLLAGVGAGWLSTVILTESFDALPLIFVAALVVAMVSLWDDMGHVRAAARLPVHLLVSATPIVGGFHLVALQIPGVSWGLGPVAGGVVTILVVAWFINLFNFMDGMDGFAGGMASIGFAVLAILGLRADALGFTLAAGSVSAASGAFLLLNLPPARIFLGDVGSATLGFLAGSFILWADRAGVAPLWIGVLVFGPFVADATITLIRRAVGGERVWEAHSTHFYQRSVKAGWSHTRTLLVQYPLMATAGLLAVVVVEAPPAVQCLAVVGWSMAFVIWAVTVTAREVQVRSARGNPKERGALSR